MLEIVLKRAALRPLRSPPLRFWHVLPAALEAIAGLSRTLVPWVPRSERTATSDLLRRAMMIRAD